MLLFYHGKDGGDESKVWGWWLIEIKALFSIALLRFENGSREAYHSHTFDSVSWVLKGRLEENHYRGGQDIHTRSLRPVITRRSTTHKVVSVGRTWVLTFRGPWASEWKEYIPGRGLVTLTHGRREVTR